MNDQEAAEIRLLFEHSSGEIQFLKRQTWTITNYVIAVYVGVVAVLQILMDRYDGGASPAELFGLGAIALLALIVGIWMLRRIDKDLTKYRERVDRSMKLLSKTFNEAVDAEELEVREKTSRSFSGILKLVILLGGLVVIYLVAGATFLMSEWREAIQMETILPGIITGVATAIVLGIIAGLWRKYREWRVRQLGDVMAEIIKHRNRGRRVVSDPDKWVKEAKQLEKESEKQSKKVSSASAILIKSLGDLETKSVDKQVKDPDQIKYVNILTTVISRMRDTFGRHDK